VTRRQFLAVMLAAIVALVLLPLQRFGEWAEAWLDRRRARAFLTGLRVEVDALYADFAKQFAAHMWSNRPRRDVGVLRA
jgi:hypothetical protein